MTSHPFASIDGCPGPPGSVSGIPLLSISRYLGIHPRILASTMTAGVSFGSFVSKALSDSEAGVSDKNEQEKINESNPQRLETRNTLFVRNTKIKPCSLYT